MALRCAECGKDNPLGTFYCGRCAAALIPEAMIPPAARHAAHAEGGTATVEAPPVEPRLETAIVPPAVMPRPSGDASSAEDERRYRIILGDTCPICRMVSRISFTPDRAPQIPIAGCRERGGCRCSLPIFAEDLHAALSGAEPSLDALAPERLATTPPEILMPGETHQAQATERPEPARRVYAPDETQLTPGEPSVPFGSGWSLPSPITQQRRRVLRELTDLYYQRRIQGIKIITTPDCCRVCAEVGASIYEPSVAPTLPIVGCWDGWQCRCMYSEETLPLDHRGLQAMERLQQLERDRELRRRRVARGGPALLHRAAALTALAAAFGVVAYWFGAAQPSAFTALLVFGLAAICAGSVLGALRRWQRLPPPGWAHLFCGAGLTGIGLHALLNLGTPGAGWLTDPSQLAALRISFHPGGTALQHLGLGLQVVGISGVAMLVVGLVTLAVAGRYERGLRKSRRSAR